MAAPPKASPLTLGETGEERKGEAEENVALPGSVPLFIRVDRYGEVSKSIYSLMDQIQNLDDVLMTLKTINQLENQAIALWYTNLEGLQKSVKEVQRNFMRPENIEERRAIDARVPKRQERKKTEAMSELEMSIRKLQEELSKMG